MAELFIELFGEEIPARMQKAAESRLRDALMAGLAEAGLGVKTRKAGQAPAALLCLLVALLQKRLISAKNAVAPVPMRLNRRWPDFSNPRNQP